MSYTRFLLINVHRGLSESTDAPTDPFLRVIGDTVLGFRAWGSGFSELFGDNWGPYCYCPKNPRSLSTMG